MTKKKEHNIRIHELAKDLNISNKELLDFLKNEGIKAKSALSSITEIEATKVKKKLQSKKPKKKVSEKSKKTTKAKK